MLFFLCAIGQFFLNNKFSPFKAINALRSLSGPAALYQNQVFLPASSGPVPASANPALIQFTPTTQFPAISAADGGGGNISTTASGGTSSAIGGVISNTSPAAAIGGETTYQHNSHNLEIDLSLPITTTYLKHLKVNISSIGLPYLAD